MWTETGGLEWTDPEFSDDGIEHINNYSVIESISSGSFGYVCIARDNNGSIYALKVLSKSKLKKAKYARHNALYEVTYTTGLANVSQEINILKILQHQNIIQLHEIINDDGDDGIIIVTNYAEHGSIMTAHTTSNQFSINHALQKSLFTPSDGANTSQHGSGTVLYMSEKQVLMYLHDIVQGLQYLHSHNIVHRDIKPSNLLLSSNNTIIIADFGCAMCFERDSNPSGLVSDTAGTLAFWAPECIQPEIYAHCSDIGLSIDEVANTNTGTTTRNDSTEDKENDSEGDKPVVYSYSAYSLDIWALGITLYCMCYNALPFYSTDENQLELFESICTCEVDANSDMHANSRESRGYGRLSAPLVDIIGHCLQKEPSLRWKIGDLFDNSWLNSSVSHSIRCDGSTNSDNCTINSVSSTVSSVNSNNNTNGKSVIFLDVDGVLTMTRALVCDYNDGDDTLLFPSDCTGKGAGSNNKARKLCGVPFERVALSNLRWLVSESHADIVLSTTWRRMPSMREYLLAALDVSGINISIVVGDTPNMHREGRGKEIAQWLSEHREYTHYVVIDDNHEESIAEHVGAQYYVKTILQSASGNYHEEGLTRERAEKALSILRSD